MKTLAALTFVALVVVANWLTASLGLVPIGLGLAVTAGTFAAGLVLLARDAVQDLGGRWWVLGAIVVGALASAGLAPLPLALASAVAFTLSELADTAVYTPLRRRGWARAAMASGIVGSVLDTVVFLAIAGFPILAGLPGQVIVKVSLTALVVALVVMVRAVFRNRVGAKSA